MSPKILIGKQHQDYRGRLFFNNDFDATPVKRIYFIKNADESVQRAWQGHKIEQRWFSAVSGSFTIKLIKIDNWENPSKNLPVLIFNIDDENLDVLHVPNGYVSSIKANSIDAKLLVLADYSLGEIKDEYRFPIDYFVE